MEGRKSQIAMKCLAWTTLVLTIAQVALVLASWVITAAWPEDFTRSLLSAEGIRWFFGNFQGNLASPVLVWLVVCSIAYGMYVASRIRHYNAAEYRQRFAMGVAHFEFWVFLVLMLVLTLVPHAILLNVLGGLFPSSFSRSIIPYVAFAVTFICGSFGLISGTIQGVEGIFLAMSKGIAWGAPLFVVYVLAAQFIYSVLYLL